MILWLIVNVENWDIRRPLPRTALPRLWAIRSFQTSRTGRGTNTGCGLAFGVYLIVLSPSALRQLSPQTVQCARPIPESSTQPFKKDGS